MTQQSDFTPQHIVLDCKLSIADAMRLVAGQVTLTLSADAVQRCDAAHARLSQVVAEDRHVYGITTGFGPLANRLVDKKDGVTLQQNLVHHLASGVGPRFDWSVARAVVLARLMSILQGASGASSQAIGALVALINSPLAPQIPSKGTVGASGDLTPLAHMALCFQGRGDFFTQSGTVIEGAQALSQLQVAPLDLSRRDGLALVNGTSAMTGIAVMNASAVERAIHWSIALSAALAEAMGGRIEAWHPAFGALRPHAKQIETARLLNICIARSQRVVTTPLADRRLTDVGAQTEDHAGQDAYTLRCVPQVIGAVWDTAVWHNSIVSTELQSATDNPIFPQPDGAEALVLHGGNFMGQHVGLASDALANSVVVLAGLAERQIACLTDEKLNRGLPAFLHQGAPGLNSGFMGAQVTATALLAEMRTSGAASTNSISTNGANQDVVSMGTIAARLVHQKIATLTQINAILGLCIAQAIDIIEQRHEEGSKGAGFSPQAKALRDVIRRDSPALAQDRPLGREIETLAQTMSQSDPPKLGS